MSVEAIALALNHSRAKGVAKLVMIGIANHDGDGGSWPSIDTLARYAGVNHRNVQKHINELIELGEIERHIQDGGTHKTEPHMRPNLYMILLRCPADCDGTSNHKPLSVATPPVGSDTPPLSVATPLPLSVPTPEPSLRTISEPSGRKRLPTPVPAGFFPSETSVAWARKELPRIDVSIETAVFVDYYRSRGRKMVDWEATWRNWMRRANGYVTERNPQPQLQAVGMSKDAVKAMFAEEGWEYGE